MIWFYLSQTSFHTQFVSKYPLYSLCLRLSVIFTLSQTSQNIHDVSYQLLYSFCFILNIKFTLSQINYSKTPKMKGLWFSIYYGWVYVYFRSVLAGCHCIVFKDTTLIELHTMNNYLTWFYLSQTIFYILFVSNHPSYSLCLRPTVIFTLSQTNWLGLGFWSRLWLVLGGVRFNLGLEG